MVPLSTQSISRNLRRIRSAKGIRQTELAEMARLSRAAYQKIERGVSQPRIDTLQRIVHALDANLLEVIGPSGELRHVRFRAARKLKTRENILVRVERWLSHFNEIEDLLNDRVEDRAAHVLRRVSAGEMQDRSPRKIALITREEFGLDEKEPIWDVSGLLESRGVKVLPLEIHSDHFFGLSVAKSDGGPAIVVNVFPRLSVERWIFSAVHELGHLVMHPGAFDIHQSEEDGREESEADDFASQFLMPRDSFEERWERSRGLDLVDRILKIKRFFGVSYKTVIKRLIQDARVDERSIYGDFTAGYQRKYHRRLRFRDEPNPMRGDAFSGMRESGDKVREPQGLEPADFMGERYRSLIRRGIEEGVVSLGWAAEALETDLPSIKEWTASWKYFHAA